MHIGDDTCPIFPPLKWIWMALFGKHPTPEMEAKWRRELALAGQPVPMLSGTNLPVWTDQRILARNMLRGWWKERRFRWRHGVLR